MNFRERCNALKRRGIVIALSANEEILTIEPDGFVPFDLSPSDRILLSVFVKNSSDDFRMYVFTIDHGKNLTPKRDESLYDEEPIPQTSRYERSVPIFRVVNPCAAGNEDIEISTTKYPTNCLVLLGLSPDGSFEIWEVALVSQNGNFFVTIQQTWAGRCYRDGDSVACPLFERERVWPQLVSILRRSYKNSLRYLAPVEEYVPGPESADNSDLEANTGRVLWFHESEGLGAVLTPEGVARIHWSQIAPSDESDMRRTLNSGAIVRYAGIRAPTTRNPQRPTKFKLELVGPVTIAKD